VAIFSGAYPPPSHFKNIRRRQTLQKFFKITAAYNKINTTVIKHLEEKNINKVIDNILQDLKERDEIHLAIWIDPDMKQGEVIVLDNNFEQEEYIKISQQEKGEIESVTL
jgi:hypothetical protein